MFSENKSVLFEEGALFHWLDECCNKNLCEFLQDVDALDWHLGRIHVGFASFMAVQYVYIYMIIYT